MPETRCLHCEAHVVDDDVAAVLLDTGELVWFCCKECRHVYMTETQRDTELCDAREVGLCYGEMLDDGFALMGGE